MPPTTAAILSELRFYLSMYVSAISTYCFVCFGGKYHSPFPRHNIVEDVNALHEGEPPGGLNSFEATVWRTLYNILDERGYRLRDRYRPGWEPSWIAKGLDIAVAREHHLEGEFEDAIPNDEFHQIMDATRTVDGQQVILKILDSASEDERELIANRLFSTEPRLSDPHNHCLPMLEEIEVEWLALRIAVFPLYRSCIDPPFHLVAEVVPMMDQLLEGLVFLHEHNVAHGDIKCANVLMDPSPLYPHGFNPLVSGRTGRSYALRDPEPVRTRLGTKIRYVYIDFGSCTVFESAEARRMIPYNGLGTFDAPEWSHNETPDGNEDVASRLYDPFACDVWHLGKFFLDLHLYHVIPALQPLLAYMFHRVPASRPTAQQALDTFRTTMTQMSWGLLARVPNPIITTYFTPENFTEYYMGPNRDADAKEYLKRMIEFLVMTDGAPRITL